MSSPMNNSFPIMPTSSTVPGQTKQQQSRSVHEQSMTTNRRHRSSLVRGGHTGKIHESRPKSINKSSQDDKKVQGSPKEDVSSEATTSRCETDGDATTSSVKFSKGEQKSLRSSRGGGSGGGKYRQRQQMNQLLDGMTGLDIDLAESIVPTSLSGRSADSVRGRHATVSRKINLTHLLNYDRRHMNSRPSRSHNYMTSYNDRSGHHHHHNYYRDFNKVHKFNKQQFLQANCQFVVLDGHDYTVHKVDPDWPVDWDCIEEIKFRQTGATETTCPICLDPPIAAKITKCGHIYCWTCMLHYLSLSDENNRQCPICFEPVYRDDLRSVISEAYSDHVVGEDIKMSLMFRQKGCIEVAPYRLNTQFQDSSRVEEHYRSQANLVIVDPMTVVAKITHREKDELLLKSELERGEPEICFVEQAIDILNKRVEKLEQMSADNSRVRRSHNDYNSMKDIDSVQQDATKSFLFYQSIDGQHIYLNPFSTKILCHEFGSLENCPPEITATILQMDWVSMNEAWRKRFKYLEHLPLTCEFRLIEIDFEKSNLVSIETYKTYESQIKMRSNERERRRREERKRDRIIQVEQNRKIYGIQPSLRINLNNEEQFPSVSDERHLNHQPRLKSTEQAADAAGLISSSDEEDQMNENIREVSNIQQEAQEVQALVETEPLPSVSAEPLSFRDIQLQEAAEEARNKNSTNKQSTSAWSRGGSSKQSNVAQSSFANLLVNTKISQKEWTRNATNKPTMVQSSFSRTEASKQDNSNTNKSRSIDLDDGAEIQRAPPNEFTINDFLDANVVSSIGKRRNKSKGTVKK